MSARSVRKRRAAARAAKRAGATVVTGAVLAGALCAVACDDGPLREVSKAVTENRIEPVSVGAVSTTGTVTVGASAVFVEGL